MDVDASTELDVNRCPAHSKQSGKQCGNRAGKGTDHVGTGLCKNHGGRSPGGRKQAQNLEAVKAVQEFGLPREVEPHQALIEELHRTAGWVAWLGEKVHAEGEDRLTMIEFGGSDDAPQPFQLNSPYYDLLTEERKQLAKVAQACISAGVEERRVRVIEQGAAFAAQAIRSVLASLGHNLDAPEVRQAVTSALSVVPAA